MLIDYVIFPWYSLLLFLGFFVTGWLFFVRIAACSFFDPLNFGVNMTNSGIMTVYTSMRLEGSLIGWQGIQAPLFTASIYFCYILSSKIPLRRILSPIEKAISGERRKNTHLHWIGGCIAFCLVFALFVSKFGFPLLYSNPLHSKMMYSGGDGSLRRFLQASCLFVQATSIIMFVKHKHSAGIFVYLIVSVLSSILVVSRSALVSHLIGMIFLLNVRGDKRANKLAIPFLFVGFLFALFTIWVGLASVLDEVQLEQVLTVFSTRVIAFGDACFYVLTSERVNHEFYSNDIFDLLLTNFSSFLATFRLIPWEEAFSTGGRIYAQIIGNYTGVGPNSTPQMEGWLYLGWFGLLYTSITSISVIIIRRFFFAALRSNDPYISFIGCTGVFGYTSILIDGSYWGTATTNIVIACSIALFSYSISAVLRIFLYSKPRIDALIIFGGMR